MDIDPEQWDKNQLELGASFLQSSFWGAFQETAGSQPHYISSKDWSCLLLERRLAFGKYLFAPYGPTLKSPDALPECLKQIKQYAKQAGFEWLTIEPFTPGNDSQTTVDRLLKLGAVRSHHNREPDLTRILDLTAAPDDLMATISQSTRSFIRKNQREKLLHFKTSGDPADIKLFVHMLDLVAGRKKVSFFSEDYFKKQAQVLMPAKMMYLELALEGDKPVASAIFHDFGEICSYTYAGSLPEARKTSASALLLWQAILNAKGRGMKKMDLYGIAPDDAPSSHPWAGFSAFKKKFGGEVVHHAGTWDIPLSTKYRLYRSAKKARKLLGR